MKYLIGTVGILLGIGTAISAPLLRDYCRNYIGELVLQAVHLHWQWEQQVLQQQSLLKPVSEWETPIAEKERV